MGESQKSSVDQHELGPLTGIRFFAAMHIFWFHINAMHQAPIPDDSWRYHLLDSLPSGVLNFVEHGYCSTSLFFILSGFILSYLYVNERKQMTVSLKEFWFARFSRIYPLHIAIVFLLLPIAFFALPPETRLFTVPVDRIVFFLVSGVMSFTLTQAWIPECALTWNFATWALSAIVFCYLVFPWGVKLLAKVQSSMWFGFIALLIVAGLAPSIVHDLIVGEEQPMSFSSELVMRNPIFWLPPFLCGMSLAMQFRISRYIPNERTFDIPDESTTAFGFSRGDAALIILMAIQCFDDKWIADHITGGHSVHFYLRHGTLTPLYLVLLLDLARGRGIASWFFKGAIWKWLGTASFSIFMLQMPGIILTNIASGIVSIQPLPKFLLVNVITLGLSITSVWLFEKPIAKFLRRRFMGNTKSKTAPSSGS
jgi:peptidoglycan/LPS O-acetylase OafA/YrhL